MGDSLGAPSKDEKTWAMIAHLASLLGYSVIPLGNIIDPLVVWQMKKEEMPFVDDQGKEALNFQISITIYLLVAVVTVIGIVVAPLIIIAGLVLTIIAGLKASNGEHYRYPLTIRFLK